MGIRSGLAALFVGLGVAAVSLTPSALRGQDAPAATGPPPSDGGFFPLSEVREGMTATAWTVFQGDKPEPMQVEILGVLRGARGPGQDMILAQLHGAKPEYTGVVAGMSGSPVYIGRRLLGSLSYRIGQFSKDPIAGITPIGQMLEVRDMPIQGTANREQGSGINAQGTGTTAAQGNPEAAGMNFQAMETPLVMSGLQPEAIRLWQKQTAGTGLDMVAAGGVGGSSISGIDEEPSAKALATVVPGSAVSAQLVRGDIEISATCTVTYIDPKQLLACGHPILQSGPVSLPMTTAEVVATLASPLNAFKIVNTGQLIGAFTEDRDSAIRGVLGQKPRMIPVHISVHSPTGERKLNVEVLDLPALTGQTVVVSLYEALLENNQSSAEMSYHLTGTIDLAGTGSELAHYGSGATVVNDGTIDAELTSGTATIDVPLTTSLTKLKMASGTETVSITQGGTFSGTLTVPSGTIFSLDGGGYAVNGATFSGAGLTRLTKGNATLTGTTTIDTLFSLSGGTISGAGNLALTGQDRKSVV